MSHKPKKKDKYIQNSLVVYTHGVYYLPIYKLAKSEQKKKKNKPSASLLGFYYIFSTWQQLLSILIDQQNKSNNDDDHHHYHRWWIINWFFLWPYVVGFFCSFLGNKIPEYINWMNEMETKKNSPIRHAFFSSLFQIFQSNISGFFCGFIILECHFIYHLDVSRNKGQ